eukprot:scaffold78102_cov54-Phaeocystis_antarctica.AAC.1
MTASGSVSDYSDTSSLQQGVATAAGVDKSLVTISVAAASVIITATIAVPASTAAAVQTSLSSTLGTADQASAALGITVESVPTVVVEGAELADAVTTESDVAGVAVAATASVLIIVALLAVGAYRWRRNLSPFDKGLSLWASFGRKRHGGLSASPDYNPNFSPNYNPNLTLTLTLPSGSVLLHSASSRSSASPRRPSSGSVSPGSPKSEARVVFDSLAVTEHKTAQESSTSVTSDVAIDIHHDAKAKAAAPVTVGSNVSDSGAEALERARAATVTSEEVDGVSSHRVRGGVFTPSPAKPEQPPSAPPPTATLKRSSAAPPTVGGDKSPKAQQPTEEGDKQRKAGTEEGDDVA